MTDNQRLSLLEKVKAGDEVAFETLAAEYEPLVDAAAGSAAQKVAELRGIAAADAAEDLRQEARIALYRAALTYDINGTGKEVTFGLYAKICVRNAMVSEIRRESAARRRHLRTDSGVPRAFDVPSDVSEGYLVEILQKSLGVLSPFEEKVLHEYVSGKAPREIAKDIGKSAKSVSNAIFRIKAKLKLLSK